MSSTGSSGNWLEGNTIEERDDYYREMQNSSVFSSAVYHQKQQQDTGAISVSFPETDVATGVLRPGVDFDGAQTTRIFEKREGVNALPAETVAALSENLPWDPEADTGSPDRQLSQRNRRNFGLDIPVVREQLLPGVRLRREAVKQSRSIAGVGRLSDQKIGKQLFETTTSVHHLSPESAIMTSASDAESTDKSCFDRRKQRTIRRIEWDTNYIPPLELNEPKDSPKQNLNVPLSVKVLKRTIGKETSV